MRLNTAEKLPLKVRKNPGIASRIGRPKRAPTTTDWIYSVSRLPAFQLWVEVYELESRDFRVAQLMEEFQWEYENGEKKACSSVLMWRDAELT